MASNYAGFSYDQPPGYFSAPDEAYARKSDEFLAWRSAPAQGYNKRTLVDLTVSTVFPNGLASHFHQVVFQPLTDPAAQADRSYVFGYESDSQTVQIRGVHVYRADGSVDDSFDTSIGVICGATGNPAILAFANRIAPTDQPDIMYAMIFPSMTIVKVLFVQIAISLAAG